MKESARSIKLNVIQTTNPSESARPAVPTIPMTDENGDSIFHFHLQTSDVAAGRALSELYRAQIYDLLKIVRLYSNGRPLLVDSFAFRNKPDHIHTLQSGLPLMAEGNGDDHG